MFELDNNELRVILDALEYCAIYSFEDKELITKLYKEYERREALEDIAREKRLNEVNSQ